MAGRHDYDILTLPRTTCNGLPEQGAWPWNGAPAAAPVWRQRAEAETDERYLQFVPYLLLCDNTGQIWCYARRGGDDRLRDRLSCGIGGHVERTDAAGSLSQTLANALHREAAEELGPEVAACLDGTEPKAWIYEGLSAIGRVHLGVLYLAVWPHAEPPRPRESALESRGFRQPHSIIGDDRFELWSRLAAEWLARG